MTATSSSAPTAREFVRFDFDPLSRETVRTPQNGSQTVLAYPPAGSYAAGSPPAACKAESSDLLGGGFPATS